MTRGADKLTKVTLGIGYACLGFAVGNLLTTSAHLRGDTLNVVVPFCLVGMAALIVGLVHHLSNE